MKVKAIIEVPEKCEDCPLSYYTEGCSCNYCQLNGRQFAPLDRYGWVEEGWKERPKWCPLNEAEIVEE